VTVPLLRVCYHCGYPTPGRHASSCPDAESGVVTVVKPIIPAEVDALRRQVAALTAELEQLRKHAHSPVGSAFDAAGDSAFELAQSHLADVKAERDQLRADLAECIKVTEFQHAKNKQAIDRLVEAQTMAKRATDERDRLREERDELREEAAKMRSALKVANRTIERRGAERDRLREEVAALKKELDWADEQSQLSFAQRQQIEAERDQAREERDLAIAHDRQPYPTAWAYEQACKALEKHRTRANKAEAERDRAMKVVKASQEFPTDLFESLVADKIHSAQLRGLERQRQYYEAKFDEIKSFEELLDAYRAETQEKGEPS
jgi:chromosome segregation ATPase